MSGSKGDWSPGKKYATLVAKIQDILENGEKRTVRDVYYALEARGDKYEYKDVKRAVKKGRRAGFINPAQIVDTSRQPVTVAASGYGGEEEFLDERVRDVWDNYWENFWEDQETYVEVWLEKQSLASVFEPICSEFNVRLEATRGDWSDSKVYEAAQRLVAKIDEGRDIHILYFGDFNPSGYHAPVSILDSLGYYGIVLGREFPGSDQPEYYDPEWGLPSEFEEAEGTFNFKRCAINVEHIDRFDLPENPVPSGSDKDETIKRHFRKFVSAGRDTNVELNALKEYEREFLESLIREEIERRIDDDVREATHQNIRTTREQLSDKVTINE